MRKKIDGYDTYEIDSNGEVYSLEDNSGGIKRARKILMKQTLHGNGYMYIGLTKNKKQKNYRVHRLVALAFILNPEDKCCVNHIDGSKANNHIDNLEWVTLSENMRHAFDVLGVQSKGSPKFGAENVRSMPVIQIAKDGSDIAEYANARVAAEALGLSRANLVACLKGRNKTFGGFKWKYA